MMTLKILSLRGGQININPISTKSLVETYKRIFKDIDAFHR